MEIPPLSQLIPTPRKDATCQLLLESGSVEKRGFLHKKQSDRKKRLFGSVLGTKWRLRYVVVSKGCVYMFKTESSTHPQRALSLFGFNEVNTDNSNKSERFKFIIKDALEDRDWNRTLGFYTKTEPERKEWIECFRREIFTANVHLYHSFGSLSLSHRSSSSPSVGGYSSPIQMSESSASLSTIMGSMSAINLQKIQESLRKTDSLSSDEDDDYTEIIEDDPEEIDESPKKSFNIRGRPPLPIPRELISADTARQKTETSVLKRSSSAVSKHRTFSCHSPRLPSSCEFKFPPDKCSETRLPRSLGSQSEVDLLPLPSRPSAAKPISPKALKPLPPVKPPKPVSVVVTDPLPMPKAVPLPKAVDPEDLAIPPKIAARVVTTTGNTRKKPLPPLPITESPFTETSQAEDDASESRTSPVMSFQEADDDDDDDEEFRLSPLVKASYCLEDKEEAQRIMMEVEEDGVFMIRKATDGQDYKTLMVRCGPKVTKYKIIREEGDRYSLHLGQSSFCNVRELLEFYFDNPVPNQSTKLTKPFTEVWTLK